LTNLEKVLKLAGSSLEQVVKYNGKYFGPAAGITLISSVYLQDMKDFAAMNEAYIAVRQLRDHL
jgi:enamine deaminase RidA (YjgF/YER057c/UK114 family)